MVKSLKKLLLIISLTIINVSHAANENNIYIFVSFSMPDATIQNLLRDAHKIKAPLIIRGLYQNSFQETTKKLLTLLPEKKGGVLLDPTLFKRFKIDKVPAFVITTQRCIEDKACTDYDVIYGDVTFHYALEELKSRTNSYAKFLETDLNKLEE
jgi:conjugal transfer pilus assembly protein TrbC